MSGPFPAAIAAETENGLAVDEPPAPCRNSTAPSTDATKAAPISAFMRVPPSGTEAVGVTRERSSQCHGGRVDSVDKERSAQPAARSSYTTKRQKTQAQPANLPTSMTQEALEATHRRAGFHFHVSSYHPRRLCRNRGRWLWACAESESLSVLYESSRPSASPTREWISLTRTGRPASRSTSVIAAMTAPRRWWFNRVGEDRFRRGGFGACDKLERFDTERLAPFRENLKSQVRNPRRRCLLEATP